MTRSVLKETNKLTFIYLYMLRLQTLPNKHLNDILVYAVNSNRCCESTDAICGGYHSCIYKSSEASSLYRAQYGWR